MTDRSPKSLDALLAPKPSSALEGLFRRAGELEVLEREVRGALPPPAPSPGSRRTGGLHANADRSLPRRRHSATLSSRSDSDRSKGKGRYPFTGPGGPSSYPISWAQGRGQPSARSKAYGDGGPLASRTSRGGSRPPRRSACTPRPSGAGHAQGLEPSPGAKPGLGFQDAAEARQSPGGDLRRSLA